MAPSSTSDWLRERSVEATSRPKKIPHHQNRQQVFGDDEGDSPRPDPTPNPNPNPIAKPEEPALEDGYRPLKVLPDPLNAPEQWNDYDRFTSDLKYALAQWEKETKAREQEKLAYEAELKRLNLLIEQLRAKADTQVPVLQKEIEGWIELYNKAARLSYTRGNLLKEILPPLTRKTEEANNVGA